MARVAYALTSQGMGHTSRALVLGQELMRRGHEVLFICGGRANRVMRSAGWSVFDVPVTGHLMRANRLLLLTSFVVGIAEEVKNRRVRYEIMSEMDRFRPDVLVNDFELYSGPAAIELGLPVVTLNHQQVLTHTHHRAPLRYQLDAFVARGVIRHIVPNKVSHTIITAWSDPRPTAPDTTLVGPIIRSSVVDATPSGGNAVLVYHNDPGYLSLLIPILGKVDARFVVYRPPLLNGVAKPANVEFRDYDTDRFIEDLARSRAVISSAGYTLMSECLWLNKPLFVIPNRRQYEQTYNALHFVENGWGESCFQVAPSAAEVDAFLDRAPMYQDHLRALRVRPGAAAAVECIQRVMSRTMPIRSAAAEPLVSTE